MKKKMFRRPLLQYPEIIHTQSQPVFHNTLGCSAIFVVSPSARTQKRFFDTRNHVTTPAEPCVTSPQVPVTSVKGWKHRLRATSSRVLTLYTDFSVCPAVVPTGGYEQPDGYVIKNCT
jgi:hypothetical protein